MMKVQDKGIKEVPNGKGVHQESSHLGVLHEEMNKMDRMMKEMKDDERDMRRTMQANNQTFKETMQANNQTFKDNDRELQSTARTL